MKSYSIPTPDSPYSRIYGLGLLPLHPHVPVPVIVQCLQHISQSGNLRGVILGTKGVGKGLDDAALDPLWDLIQARGLVAFLHPYFGAGEASHWSELGDKHIVTLALGFPMEITIVSCLRHPAVYRMWLTCVLRPLLDSFSLACMIGSPTSRSSPHTLAEPCPLSLPVSHPVWPTIAQAVSLCNMTSGTILARSGSMPWDTAPTNCNMYPAHLVHPCNPRSALPRNSMGREPPSWMHRESGCGDSCGERAILSIQTCHLLGGAE